MVFDMVFDTSISAKYHHNWGNQMMPRSFGTPNGARQNVKGFTIASWRKEPSREGDSVQILIYFFQGLPMLRMTFSMNFNDSFMFCFEIIDFELLKVRLLDICQTGKPCLAPKTPSPNLVKFIAKARVRLGWTLAIDMKGRRAILYRE